MNALVTGGSRGIGAAIAASLAARGVRVALQFQRNRPAAEEVLARLPGDGHALIAADLGTAEGSAAAWHEASRALGGIQILVNNAGIYEMHPPLTTGEDAWNANWARTLAVNLVAPAVLSHAAVRAMDAAGAPFDPEFGRGRIVNVTSRGAFRGEPEAPAYGASKAGLNSLGQSLARALAPRSIYVFSVAPGWVETDMAAPHLTGPAAAEIAAQHPLGRIATPGEIARTVTFCALDAPPAMTGSIIDVNGASYLRT